METTPFVKEESFTHQDPTGLLLIRADRESDVTTNKGSLVFPYPSKDEPFVNEGFNFTELRSWYPLPSEVKGFCEKEKLLDSLHKVRGIIQDSFLHIKELDIRLSPDPETGEIVVVFDLAVQGEVDDVVEQYHACTNKWVKEIPDSDSDKLRLVFNII